MKRVLDNLLIVTQKKKIWFKVLVMDINEDVNCWSLFVIEYRCSEENDCAINTINKINENESTIK